MLRIDVVSEEIVRTEGCRTNSGTRDICLQREPSFSRWCAGDYRVSVSLQKEENLEIPVEVIDFELPFLPRHEPEHCLLTNSRYHSDKLKMETKHVNGGTLGTVGSQGEGTEFQNYEPFNIENGSLSEGAPFHVTAEDLASVSNPKVSSQSSQDPVSAANVLKTLFFILMWYTFSTFLTIYNKTLLGNHMGKFPAPLLMNTIHFTMQAFLSKFITWGWSHRFQTGNTMSWRDYFVKVVPTALATAMDVNLSNVSLVFISVTFATMCKSAGPIFLILFAFAFRLESPSFQLFGIITVISTGILFTDTNDTWNLFISAIMWIGVEELFVVMLAVYCGIIITFYLTVAKETSFEFWGFVFVMLAAVMSGFRWCMTQILLQKEAYGLKDPLTLMSYVSPVMALSTAFLSIFLDPWHELTGNKYFNNSWHIFRSLLLMFLGGTLAFFMVLTEYVLVSVTSAVTVTIAGVVKEAVTILVAVFYFHEEFTWLKGVGLLIIMIGVSLFNWYKYQKLLRRHHGEDDGTGSPMLNPAAKYVILEEMEDRDEDI